MLCERQREKPAKRNFNNQDRREVLRESGVMGGEKLGSDLGSVQGLGKFGAREVQGGSGGMGFGAEKGLGSGAGMGLRSGAEQGLGSGARMGLGSGAELVLGSGAELVLGSDAEKGLGPGAEMGEGMELDGGQEQEGGVFLLPGKRRGKQGTRARRWKGGSPGQGGSGYVSGGEEGGVSPMRASANRFSIHGNSFGSLESELRSKPRYMKMMPNGDFDPEVYEDEKDWDPDEETEQDARSSDKRGAGRDLVRMAEEGLVKKGRLDERVSSVIV